MNNQHIKTIEEYIRNEVKYNVSCLVTEMLEKLIKEQNAEDFYNLLEGTNWSNAEDNINKNNCNVILKNELWGVENTRKNIYIIEPSYKYKHQAIEAYFDFDLSEFKTEIFQYWIVTEYFANKLEEKGESVEKDFYSLCIWGRTQCGQGISDDSVIKQIYEELIK